MRRRAAGRRDSAAVVAGLLLLHASCQLEAGGTADAVLADASVAGTSGSGGALDSGPDGDIADVTPLPDANGDAAENADADARTDGGDAGLACGVNPPPLGGPICPPQCNGGCGGNRCRVLCAGVRPCTSIRCPEGFDCEITCAGPLACAELQVQCDSQHRCGVICESPNACSRARIQCGSGSCGMLCASGACVDATLNCGSGECFAWCPLPPQPPPLVNCFDSCSCTPC